MVTNSCLKYLQALTSNLQAEAKDIVEAVQEISSVRAALHNARSNIDKHHRQWFQKVEKMCSDIDVEPCLSRRCCRQTHRSNVPADTPSEYYCRTASIPLFDHLLSEMDSRFSSHQQTALFGLSVVPSIMLSLSREECTTKLTQFAEMYQNDLPSPDCIESELHCWLIKWQHQVREHGQASLPSNSATCDDNVYPNIRVLVSILCTLPVTSCSAERSFSAVKWIKTALRSSMGTARLTGLALLHLHRDIPLDISKAIDEFARRHPRRLQMTDILAD